MVLHYSQYSALANILLRLFFWENFTLDTLLY